MPSRVSPSDAKHNAMMGALMKRVGEPLIGELADCSPRWRRGFFDGAGLDGDRVKAPFPERLAALFHDPSAVLLRQDHVARCVRQARRTRVGRRARRRTANSRRADAQARRRRRRSDAAASVRSARSAPHRLRARVLAGLRAETRRRVARRAALDPRARPGASNRCRCGSKAATRPADDLAGGARGRLSRSSARDISRHAGRRAEARSARSSSSFARTLTRLWLDVPSLSRADYQLLLAHRDRFKALRRGVRGRADVQEARLRAQ